MRPPRLRRVLFICKHNECYGFTTYTRRSAGLFNSTRFIVEGLGAKGIEAKIVEVEDNNAIDREVAAYKPDFVVVEALWVVPEKFDVLKRLHPRVRWFCHLHSNMPFLALEGIAMEWIFKYARKEVGLIANSEESFDALSTVLREHEIQFLPNVYLTNPRTAVLDSSKEFVDVGCFGAVRPLKNHLTQALAAIQFARSVRKSLRFHVNSTRLETGGGPVLKNLVSLFDQTQESELVQHPWMEPEDFLNFLQQEIDISLQVSLSETFNVVTADAVTAGVPVVVSDEVSWVTGFSQAEADSAQDIARVMRRAYGGRLLVRWNQSRLSDFSKNAQKAWYEFVTQ